MKTVTQAHDAINQMISQGRWDDAQMLAVATAINHPDDGMGWKILGSIRLRCGPPADALEALKIAARLLPNDAEVMNNYGCALEQVGQRDHAEHYFRRALDFDPNFAVAYNNLGATLRQMLRLNESMANLQTAIALNPNYANAHFNLGLTLHDLARYDDAATSFRRALEVAPEHVPSLHALGNCEAARGQFDEAERLYRQATALDPTMTPSWAAIPAVRKMSESDSDWAEQARRLLDTEPAPEERARLEFSLGKYEDDLGDFDLAFQHYRIANEISKKFIPPYDAHGHKLTVDRCIDLFDRCAMEGIGRGASDSERPVFVVGMPRSGTTLVEQIIASHRDAAGAGELAFWQSAAEKHLSSESSWRPHSELLRDLAASYLDVLTKCVPDAQRIVDKAPVNFMNLWLIHTVFPGARIIHARRDPLDTCLSIYFQNFSAAYNYANDLYSIAAYYREYSRLSEHWRVSLPRDVYLEVPYEALVVQPNLWIPRIIGFLGLEWDPQCLKFDELQRRVGTASQWQVRQPIYQSSVGRWRNYDKYLEPLRCLAGLSQIKEAGGDR